MVMGLIVTLHYMCKYLYYMCVQTHTGYTPAIKWDVPGYPSLADYNPAIQIVRGPEIWDIPGSSQRRLHPSRLCPRYAMRHPSPDPPHTGYTPARDVPAMQWRSRILPTQAENYGMLQLKTCTCTSRFMKLLQQLIPTGRIHCNLFWPGPWVVCLRLPPLHCSHEVRRLSATVMLSRVNNCSTTAERTVLLTQSLC